MTSSGADDIHAPSAGAGATVVSRGGGDGGGGSSTKSGKRGGAVADRLNQVRSMGSARGKNGTSGMCDGEDERRATGAAHAVYAGPFSPPKGGEGETRRLITKASPTCICSLIASELHVHVASESVTIYSNVVILIV